MIPYITYREEKEGNLLYYILQKEHPHYVGVIAYNVIENKIQIPITEHNLYVTFAGTIAGNYIPSYKDVVSQIENTMSSMAIWFYDNRILKEPKKYQKFKINVSSPNQQTIR
jgi:hypothetical protein